ncbi:MAG: type II toxin-antitoxin system PemK/MazF family toxin [Patescibacteria group bacterium]
MLKFQPKPGSVIYCNYRGFVAPEMIKKRPVIIVSKHKHNSKLVTIVPISTTKPVPVENYHLEMDIPFCALYLEGEKSWVKCDMINVVSLDRLNLIRDKRSGNRHAPAVGSTFLLQIKDCIKKAHSL